MSLERLPSDPFPAQQDPLEGTVSAYVSTGAKNRSGPCLGLYCEHPPYPSNKSASEQVKAAVSSSGGKRLVFRLHDSGCFKNQPNGSLKRLREEFEATLAT